ncbi:hypothetical protein [Bauldia sp.]|uniref:hypothetical protein n=1 Tax=Bauldia sp. TaxID=2575872 RepID=UPI003BACC7BD
MAIRLLAMIGFILLGFSAAYSDTCDSDGNCYCDEISCDYHEDIQGGQGNTWYIYCYGNPIDKDSVSCEHPSANMTCSKQKETTTECICHNWASKKHNDPVYIEVTCPPKQR